MANSFYTLVAAPVLGWLAVVSLTVVVYLVGLKVREIRHHRRMDEERHRLGLRRA